MSTAEPIESASLEPELLSVADEAARAAAAELMSRFGHSQAGIRSKSSPTDLVSDADLSAERAIRAVLAARRPRDAILGEEGGATGDGDLRWVIDPLDGTTNFLFGFPQFAVSVAARTATAALVGVVLDPVRDECSSATRSGLPRISTHAEIGSSRRRRSSASALVATGFSYDAGERARQAEVLRPRAAPGTRRPPRRRRRAGPRLGGVRPRRRVLRARRQGVGRRRRPSLVAATGRDGRCRCRHRDGEPSGLARGATRARR